MSQPDDEGRQALERLNHRLDAFTADRAPKGSDDSAERSMGEGYRLLGEMIGGVLGGLGLGWVVDHFAHTTPIFLVVGMLLGFAASTYTVVKAADRMGRAGKSPPPKED